MKTVKHPRLGKAEAARTLHVHRCPACRHVFQVRNADCPSQRPGLQCCDLCAACQVKWVTQMV